VPYRKSVAVQAAEEATHQESVPISQPSHDDPDPLTTNASPACRASALSNGGNRFSYRAIAFFIFGSMSLLRKSSSKRQLPAIPDIFCIPY
jgi:hypothetical protein